MKSSAIQRLLSYLLGVVVLTCMAYAAWLFSGTIEKTHTITLTENGFKPSELTIKKGETVTFKTKTGEIFWPASNQHPSHGELPEFDPERPIAPDATWDFTFTRVGVWNFHDHLNSQFRGTVRVVGSDGGTKEECIDRSEEGRQNSQFKCWEDEFLSAIDENGVEGAFALSKLYFKDDTLFQTNCHDIMHLVGKEGYKLYKNDKSVVANIDTTMCDFGFYHGFTEEMITSTGNYEESVTYCAALEDSALFNSEALAKHISISCSHGIGHGIFDSLPGNIWGNGTRMLNSGIDKCTLLFDDKENLRSCIEGVTNGLSIAYNSKQYSLSFDQGDHFKACNSIDEMYQTYCFEDIGTHYANSMYLSPQDALKLFKKEIPERFVNKTHTTYVSNYVQQQVQTHTTVEEHVKLCLSFETGVDINGCIHGVIGGLMLHQEPEIYVDLIMHFCSQFEDPYMNICAEAMVPPLKYELQFDFEYMKGVCANITQKFGIQCEPQLLP